MKAFPALLALTARRDWTYARAWDFREIKAGG